MSTFAPGRMSGAGTAHDVARRRVRHEVRDGVAVILFSATASTALAGAMLLLVTLTGRGA